MATTTKAFKTDKELRALPPAPKGKTYDVSDVLTRGLKVRIGSETARGHTVRVGKADFRHFPRTWVYVGRFPGSTNPTRVKIGEYCDDREARDHEEDERADRRRSELLTLEEAREIAAEWRRLIRKGMDPRQAERDRKAAEARAAELKEATFKRLAEDYMKSELPGQRRGAVVGRLIQRELIALWGDRPASSITQEDVESLIDGLKLRAGARNMGAGSYARNVLQAVRSIYNWGTAIAARRTRYGTATSPCRDIKPSRLIGKKRVRKRVLEMREMRALWGVAGTIGYPFGQLTQLIMLTGCRRSEIANSRWPEFHPQLVELLRAGEPIAWREVPDDLKLLTIPPERFKQDDVHIVPLSNAACVVLAALPHFAGDCVFSTRAGLVPIDGFSIAKKRIDAALAAALGYAPAPWTFHDIRRTVRTGLAALGIRDEIAELAIGHAREGIKGTYDRHKYLAERRRAFKQWAVRLLGPESGDLPKRRVWGQGQIGRGRSVRRIKPIDNVVRLRA